MARNKNRLAALSVILLAAAGGLAAILAGQTGAEVKKPLGLVTSLPIYWNESEQLSALIAEDAPVHWVREALQDDFTLVPLDRLAGENDPFPSDQMRGLAYLIIAQPRAFAPADFAALDDWVRGGGKVLIFADPLLSEHSEFGLGDPRRPQGAALLSPILSRWGLQATFDPDQPAGLRQTVSDGLTIPIEQSGVFAISAKEQASCTLQADGLIATCEIGKGSAVLFADAAMLDAQAEGRSNRAALDWLTATAFGP